VRGGNDTLDSAARKALASEVGELQRRLVDLGNATDPLGGYLFGGQNNAAPPFSATGGTLNYTGDGNPRQVELSADAVVPVSTPGQPLLTNLYERLDALRKGLADGTAATVSSEIENLRKSVQEINLERGAIGARLQTVSNVESQHLRREDELTARISDTEEVDMGEAIMDYRLAETAYEAALNVASQGFRLSLMDFIRG
jgi:flagellar hook-associated protein 3 FlgL